MMLIVLLVVCNRGVWGVDTRTNFSPKSKNELDNAVNCVKRGPRNYVTSKPIDASDINDLAVRGALYPAFFICFRFDFLFCLSDKSHNVSDINDEFVSSVRF